MNITRKKLREGERVPKWYGLSYHLFSEEVSVFYPIPLNLIVRHARDWWWYLRNPGPDAHMKIWQTGFDKGRELREDWLRIKCDSAYRRGQSDGRMALYAELIQQSMEWKP